MEFVTNPILWQVLGALILLAALAHAGVATASALSRVSVERDYARQTTEIMRARADTIAELGKKQVEDLAFGWSGFRKLEVFDKVPEAPGVHSIYFRAHDGKPLPGFKPGQFLTFALKIDSAGKPVNRCYSLSDSPGKDYYRVTIKKVPPPRDKPEIPPGLSSTYFNEDVQVGDILDVKAPGGHFFLDLQRKRPAVLIGGGIGITPVLSMLNAICESGSTQETWFFLGVRHAEEHVQKEHIENLAREHENVHLVICYSDPTDEDVIGRDYQFKGRVGKDAFETFLPSNNYEFYICGPPPMMTSVTDALYDWGVPKDDVHFEAFGPASVKKPAAGDAGGDAAKAPAAKATVTFAKSGKTLEWDGSADTLLTFAEEKGVVLDSGCGAGGCGTCLLALKSGEVDYITEPGSQPEAGSCLPCISVPKGDIVLDA